MAITIHKKSVIKYLFFIVALLLLGNCFGRYLKSGSLELSEYAMNTFYNALDFNTESNLPTLFSSFLLFTDSILLFIIARGHKSNTKLYKNWIGLAVFFCFLGLDEILHIHEHFVKPVRSFFNTTGYFYFAWFLPYLIISGIMGLAYVSFFRKLPSNILRLFLWSAIIFLSGAVGLEAIGGHHAEFNGEYTLTYFYMYTAEELLEMTGTIVFMYALLIYISVNFNNLKLEFNHDAKLSD